MQRTGKKGAHAGCDRARSGGIRATVARLPRKLVIALCSILVAACAVPAFAVSGILAASYSPTYDWYSEGSSTYTLDSAGDFIGFTNLVNGTATDVSATAVSFEGKTVTLAAGLNFSASALVPVGTEAHPFAGTFDGGGYTIGNFTLTTASMNENVGLFGYTSSTSQLKNIVIGNGAKLTMERTADQALAVKNIGLLAGTCGGSMTNCSVTSNCSVSVSNAMDQTADITFPIMNVGTLAGQCLGNMSGCSNAAPITVSETGGLYIPEDGDYVSAVVAYVGGLAGCVGTEDSSVIGQTAAASPSVGAISSCTNTGRVTVDTPKAGQVDRFGNQTYINAAGVGGIAGYTRGSVSNCENTGVLDCLNTRDIGGIVGSLRASMDSTNFSQEGQDDGTSATSIVLSGCVNSGSIVAYAFPGGIVGRAGTYTTITSCVNGVTSSGSQTETLIIGTRPTKPFIGGIAGATYGNVTYCANLGTSVSALHSAAIDIDAGTYTQGGGYYASGIVGLTEYYTDENNVRNQPMPEIYGCYMAGAVDAVANMRQRAIVGDNEGYCHDCVAINDCGTTELFYTEGGAGTYGNCYFVDATALKANSVFDATTGATPLSVLNACGDVDGWVRYWALSNSGLNGGYPILNTQIDQSLRTSIASATVAFAENAEYTGDVAVPTATVTFGGKTLVQGVDFRVISQADATEISTGTPYTGSVEGIGYYKDIATQTFAYGIGQGDLSNFTVLIDSADFNWEAQTLASSAVHVTNAKGVEIDSSQYEIAFDPTDKDLTNGQAIDAATYSTIVTPSDASTYFKGENTEGTFTIKPVKIVWSDDVSSVHATVEAITYNGQEYAWQSTSANIADDQLLQLAYTGYQIKPDVAKVTYLGRELTKGVDYRVVYDSTMDGSATANPNVDVGDGWIICRYVAGSNFSNYDLMKFKIVAQTSAHDIAGATVQGNEDIVFEEGGVYTPITVWYGGSQLVEGTDYSISYQDNDKVGTASYTITGIGTATSGFTGTKTGTFNIIGGSSCTLLYSYDEESLTAAVTGVEYTGSLDTFSAEIPSTVTNGGTTYTVTSIANNAFGGTAAANFTGSVANTSKTKLASVSIPATVTSIGTYAFGSAATAYKMTNLVSVTIAEGSKLTTIGNGAFCTAGITTFTVPQGVTSIGSLAFSGTALTSVTFLSTSASQPTFVTTTTKNSFKNVTGVKAYGYDLGTSSTIYTYVNTTMASKSWTWNSLGPVPTTVKYGDVNGDDLINSTDAMLTLRYSAKLIDETALDLTAADVSGDGVVNSTDAMLILRYSAKLIDEFPIEQ